MDKAANRQMRALTAQAAIRQGIRHLGLSR